VLVKKPRGFDLLLKKIIKMTDLANRYKQNPILSPKDLNASEENLEITCLLNPGAFQFDNKIWLLIRVAEKAGTKRRNYFLSNFNRYRENRSSRNTFGSSRSGCKRCQDHKL